MRYQQQDAISSEQYYDDSNQYSEGGEGYEVDVEEHELSSDYEDRGLSNLLPCCTYLRRWCNFSGDSYYFDTKSFYYVMPFGLTPFTLEILHPSTDGVDMVGVYVHTFTLQSTPFYNL